MVKHPAQCMPRSKSSVVHGGSYNSSVNYPLRFTSGLWHNGERTRQCECEDPDFLMCSAYAPLDLGGKMGANPTLLVVWSFLSCQGRLGIPQSVPQSHLEQSPQVTLRTLMRGPDLLLGL